ncbi:MAG: alpha/beta hydrolase [Anaerolineae bacterium]
MFIGTNDVFNDAEHQPFHWNGANQRSVALLVHGFPGTPSEMRPIAEVFHGMGWAVRGVLLPGFGRDIETILERTHEDWVSAVGAELFALKQAYQRVILIGFSMGGAIVMTLADRHQVDGIVLFSPFVEVDHLLWKALPVVRFFVPKIKIFKLFKPNFSDEQTREGIRRFMPDADLDDEQVQRDILEFELPVSMFDEIRTIGRKASEVAPHLNTPSLVFQGMQDELVQPTQTRSLINRMGAVRYHEVDAPHEIINPALPAWSQIVMELQQFAEQIESK